MAVAETINGRADVKMSGASQPLVEAGDGWQGEPGEEAL